MADKGHIAKIAGIILVAILILIIVIAIIYLVYTNYSSDTFIGGFRSSNYKERSADPLITLKHRNYDLMIKAASNNMMDIKEVLDVYESFLDSCDQTKCPRYVYDRCEALVTFIQDEIDFASTNNVNWKHVRIAMNEMDDFLTETLQAASLLGDTASGGSDSYFSDLAQQYKSSIHKKSCDYGAFVAQQSDLKSEISEGVQNQMNLLSQYDQIYKGWDTLEQYVPKGNYQTAYEQQVLAGKENPIPKNIRDYRRGGGDTILDSPLEEDFDERDKDLNITLTTELGVSRDQPIISNYRGRHNFTGRACKSKCNKKSCC